MRRGRKNLYEELGRVEGERSNKNRRAEVSRIHGELNKGYKAGGRATRFRSSGPEGKPHSTKEGRSAEAQRAYMRKHGPQKPRRKTLAVTDKYKEAREKLKDHGGFKPLRAAKATGGRIEGGWPKGGPSKPKDRKIGYPKPGPDWKDRLKDVGKRFPRPKENLIEKMGGSEKAKPHSTKEGRVASGKRRIRRILKAGDKPKPRPPGRSSPGWKKRPERIMTPLRAKKAAGGIIKKIISKIKPKPVPKAVTDVDRPFKGYDKSYTRADEKKINSMLKNLGDEIKAAPLPPQLKKTLKKAQKAFPHKKAKGGPVRPIDIPWPKKRVKKGHGGSAQSHYLQHGYGPTKVKLRSGKPKLAKKGW